MPSLFLPSLVLLTAAVGLPAQQTWTVASNGGAQFLDIAAAVAVAADGDLIWVAPGIYGPVVIDGKSLTVLGHSGANGVFVANAAAGPPFAAPPPITIRNLTANQHVHVSGVQAFTFAAPPADVLLHDCAGTVWLEDLFCDSYGAPALLAERCANLVIVNSFMQTNLMPATPGGVPVPGPGARFVDCRVHAYGSQFHGSHGVLQAAGFPVPTTAGDGGSGIEIVGSLVTMQGGYARGSGGTVWQSTGCQFAGNGGDGAVLTSSAINLPELRHRDAQFQPGFVFATGPYCGAPPVNGIDVRVVSGQAIVLPGDAHALTGGGGFVAPSTATIEVTGAPGELVALFASQPAPAIDVFGLAIHLAPGLIDLGFVLVGGNGKAVLPIALQALPPGVPPFLGALQALVLDAGGNLITTGPATIAIR